MEQQLAIAFPAGEYLSDELAARNWSQTEFAEILGRPTQFVSEIVSGKKEITRESAAQIGAALGTSAEVWLNLQNSYLLWQQSKDVHAQSQLNDVRRRARLNALAPIGVLKKRGYLAGNSLDELESEILQLFKIADLNEEPALLAAAKRSNVDEPLTPTQNAWLACARNLAEMSDARPFDREGLKQLAETLSTHLADPEAFNELPALFATVGVRLVYVEALPASKLNGASFLLDGDSQKPVVAISGRGKRLDKVLFTLLHEVAHVVNGDVHGGVVLHDELSHTLGDEQAADIRAANWLVPGELPAIQLPIRAQWIANAAAKTGVHPIVIIGKLQNDRVLDWRTQLVKGAPSVTSHLERWHKRR